jgi:hypothetical protein
MYDFCDSADPLTALTADRVDIANWLLSSSMPANPNRRDNIAQKLSQASPIAVLASPEKDVPDVPG